MVNEIEFEKQVFLIALGNAYNYGGKANPKALIGKIMPKFPGMKKDMAHFMQVIENIVTQVNNMSYTEQKIKLLDLNPKYLEKKAEKKENNKRKEGLMDLPGIGDSFVGRSAPAPSGHLHIGHLRGIIYNYEYKKRYGGKYIVRLEDTNPEKIDLKNYDKIVEDINWITDNGIDEVFIQSDRVKTYYKYLRQLIETNHAYVCECEAEVFKTFNDSSEACPHRERDVERQLYLYEKFFRKENPYKDGEAIIRFKGDLKNKNPALRDIPIARLNSNEHARVGKKYRLWPMYNFTVSVDDYLMGINYIIRGKDAEIGAIRQDMIKDALGFKKCNFFHFGMINFSDIELGKTPIKEKIEKGIYDGWDDPRVPTLSSFRRRGFKAKAFRDMIIAQGMSKRDSKMTEKEYFKSINYYNKQILEKESNRFFFVMNPKEVEILDLDKFDEKEITLPKHPEEKKRGNRIFKLSSNYLIDGIDFENIGKGDTIRLMHFANFEIIEKTDKKLKLKFLSKDYNRALKVKRNIHFIPTNKEEQRKVTIVMQDNSKVNGVSEVLYNPKVDTSLQFERFGFVRLDEIKDDGTRVFWFTHR